MDEKEIKKNKDAELSVDYNLGTLQLFVLPSIFTFVFIAVYQIVDGVFISRFNGPYAIAAVNLYYPVISLLLAIGMMMGTGANAIVVSLLGQGRREEADRIFSQTLILAFLVSVAFAVLGVVFADPVMRLLGATDVNTGYLKPYYYVLTICAPAVMFQTMLGILIIGEGKTTVTAVLIIIGGVLNIVLDYVFMGPLKMGTLGAAIATAIGYIVPVAYAVWFYSPLGGSKYHFRFCRFEFGKIGKLLFNGSSEMISNLAAGVTALLMNRIAFKLCGNEGVSVVSVYLYVQFIVMAVFMGMTTAVEPVLSYHYGSGNAHMRRKIFGLSMILTVFWSLLMAAGLFLFRRQITGIFFKPSQTEFYDLACRSILLTIPAALTAGYNIFISGMFTAFSNGLISAILSGVRTFAVLSICIFIFSLIFGSDGLWASWAGAEACSLILSIVMVLKYRKKYL